MPCPPPGDLPGPGTEPGSPTLQAVSLPSEPPTRKPSYNHAPCKHSGSTYCCSAAKPCLTLCDPMDRSTPFLLSFTICWSLLAFMYTESVVLFNHLIHLIIYLYCFHLLIPKCVIFLEFSFNGVSCCVYLLSLATLQKRGLAFTSLQRCYAEFTHHAATQENKGRNWTV